MEPIEKNLPTLKDISNIIFNEELCIQFLFDSGIFYGDRLCPKCNQTMKLYISRKTWRCTKNVCGGEESIKTESFFAKSPLPCHEILLMGYLWLNRTSPTSIITMTGLSSHTVCNYNKHFRQLVADSLELEDIQIGGPGIIVEVDETKLGKRKYNRGHYVEGVWVVGGVERTEEGKVFMARVENRNAETLLNVLARHICPGSIVFSDMWRGYLGITERLGLEHHTVNHSREFIAIDGTHTNTIEATWCGLKLLIPKRNRTKNVDDHLWEYVWRKRHSGNLWTAFIHALKEVSY